MPCSIINNKYPVDRDIGTVSIVHDVNAQARDYSNGFIILESVNVKGANIIDLYELIVEENGQVKINHAKADDIGSFKKIMAEKNCYAYSFGLSSAAVSALTKNISEEREKILKKRLDLSLNYTREQKPGFFSQSAKGGDDDLMTSFEWARLQALNVTDVHRGIGREIPGGITHFIKVAEHIGNLSPAQSQCRVM
jgi:hypothetical protein